HPDAVGGVERQVDGAHPHLAVRQVADRLFHQLQVAGLDLALRPLAEHPALEVRHAAYSPASFICSAALFRSGALGERIAVCDCTPSCSALAARSCDMIFASTAWPARSNDSRCSTT